MAERLSRRSFLNVAARSLTILVGLAATARAQEWARTIHQATRNTWRKAVGVRVSGVFGGRPKPYKDYLDAKRSALPEPEEEPSSSLAALLRPAESAAAASRRPVRFATLTRLLEAANGVTDRGSGSIALRAAPSAGALYAGEIYVAVEDVKGLAPGLYYYAPLSRELARLRAGSQRAALADAFEDPGRTQGAAAFVLLTSVFPRYRWRYANRGYRYALIDVGHIGENLRLSTASAGLQHWSPARFEDDRIHALLSLDGMDEAVCAVHVIGASGPSRVSPSEIRRLVEAGAIGGPLPEAADDAPERYHAATKLVATRGRPGESAPARTPRGSDPPPGQPAVDPPRTTAAGKRLVELVRRDDPGEAIERTIRRRRSARHFESGAVGRQDLGYALDAALGRAEASQVPVELYVFVHRGRNLPAGLYRALRSRSGAPALELLRSGDFSERLVDVCLGQEKAGQAAVGIAIVGWIEAAAEAGGERSYRDLCVAAGAIAQRVYLAAESTGLAARNLSAFVDDRLNALAGLDGHRRAVLHLTMLGPGD